MANTYRRLVAQAIRNNGGYNSSYHTRFPLSFDVSMYRVNLNENHIRSLAKESNPDLPDVQIEWDPEQMWYQIQDELVNSLDSDCYYMMLSDIARRTGFSVKSQFRFYRRIKPGTAAGHPAGIEGWEIVNPYIDNKVSATFELYGRCGKHLCIAEFEGRKLSGWDADDLASAIETDDSGQFSNSWCQRLYAMILTWDKEFNPTAVKAEGEYLAADQYYQRAIEKQDEIDQRKKEAEERAFWSERDVVTI